MRTIQTAFLTAALTLSSALAAMAGPVAGCQDLTPPGTWSRSVASPDTATSLGNDSTYQFILGTPEVQTDASGEWDLIETYSNATLLLNNTADAPWFNACDETNQFVVNVGAHA